MLEKLKNLEFKTIVKFIGLGLALLVFLLITVGLISLLMNSLDLTFFRTSSRGGGMGYEPSYKSSESISQVANNADGSLNYTQDKVPSNIQNGNYDVKTYNVNIESSELGIDCNSFLSSLNKDYIKKDYINQSKHYCSFSVKVLKGKEQEFINFLNSYKVKDLNTNISNIVKSYTNLSDKIEETQKRLTETEKILNNSNTSYDELWNSLKGKNVSAESIDALNKIILNKSELISKFSKQREELVDTLNMYKKQKQDYDEQLRYIDFFISFTEKVTIDFETIKDGWYFDYKELLNTFNDTLRNLTVNLLGFILKTINFVIYAVLSIFFILIGGKGLYRMGRVIIYGKKPE